MSTLNLVTCRMRVEIYVGYGQTFPLPYNVNILILQSLWSVRYPMNILRKNAFKRIRPRCVGPRYLLINKIAMHYIK